MFQPKVVLAEIGEGAQIVECKQGPRALKDYIINTGSLGSFLWGPTITSDAGLVQYGKLAIVSEFIPKLASALLETTASNKFPVVIGGDHSCAVGTWSGIATHYKDKGDIGLIWIDAHLDSHTPDTSESGAPHGMPLASLLGFGDTRLTEVEGWRHKIKPHNAVVIGARSSELGEETLLDTLGVRVMRIEEVKERGFAACLKEAIEIVSKDTVGYGITFDIDALDPIDAPGVGSPEAGGLHVEEVVEAFETIKPKLVGFELVEYNPAREDAELTTAKACVSLLKAVMRA